MVDLMSQNLVKNFETLDLAYEALKLRGSLLTLEKRVKEVPEPEPEPEPAIKVEPVAISESLKILRRDGLVA